MKTKNVITSGANIEKKILAAIHLITEIISHEIAFHSNSFIKSDNIEGKKQITSRKQIWDFI